MTALLSLAGFCAIVAGLIQIYARDMAWKSAQWFNKLHGAKSERTREWEAASIFQGILGVIGGIALLWLASQAGNQQSRGYETIETPVTMRPRR